jgi:4-hydroxy-tetrahydrodipicolinate synthase
MTYAIEGVLPILHTPFTADDEIDLVSFRRQIDWAFSVGANGVCLAMVSELLRLTVDERLALTQSIVEMSKGRGAVVVSVGAECTKAALNFARHAESAGCHAIMAIPPINTALPATAIADYFRALADEVALPLIIQDASGYVGQPIPLDLMADLLQSYGPEKILFKPEASPIGPNLSALRDRTNGQARVLEGSGGILLVDSFRRGIAGTMPGVDLLDGIVALWSALQAGDDAGAYRVYFPICAIVALQMQAGLDGFLAIEKYILVKRKLFASDRRRMPYAWSLDDETRAEVDRLLEQLARALS